jgi:hypothetical protein
MPARLLSYVLTIRSELVSYRTLANYLKRGYDANGTLI